MSVVNKFIDSENFATAISVYDDVNLLIKSPDGFYQFNGIYREQVGGFLSPEIICPACALPCGEIAGESSDIRGTFLAEISGGTDIGAVIVYSIVGGIIPDGVLATYNGQTYNQLTYIGNNQGPVGLNTPSGQPTYYGSNQNTPSTTPPILVYNIQTDGTYVSSGNSQAITVNSNQLDLRGGGTRVYTQVIPKDISSASVLNIDYYAPIQGTFFSFQTDCPIQLDSFLGSSVQADDTCADATINYYFAQNATVSSIQPTVFVPETLTTPGIGNYVFLDGGAINAINNTATSQFIVLADNTYIEIQYGIVISTGTCTPAGLPCGGTLNAGGGTGSFTLDVDTGSTAADVGAMVVYFWPQNVPDGILVTFDNSTYNELSSPVDGYKAAPAGLVTYVGSSTSGCFNTLVPNSPYNSAPSNVLSTYDPVSQQFVVTGTRDYTVVASQLQPTAGTSPGYCAMVIPKPALPVSGNNQMTIDVYGPCGTSWNLDLTLACPGQLPSVQASANQGTSTTCQTVTQTIYYNYNYDDRAGTINPPQFDPTVNNFVFSDQFATTPLTAGNYTVSGISSTFIITVDTNGVIASTQSCSTPPPPTNSCKNNFSAQNSGSGYFTADIDVGGTASDIGAIVVHMYLGGTEPDGVLATYNGNTYNILTSQNNSNQYPFGRRFNSGTGDPTYVGFPNTFSGSPYQNIDEYELQNGVYQSLGTTRNISITGSQNETDGEDVFTLVIPKPFATPSDLNIEFFAPLTNTFFTYNVGCPAALPSFSSSPGQADNFCNAATETYYFARNATYSGSGSGGFTTDTNTLPKIGNFVYEDSNAVTPLNDNSTPLNYILGGAAQTLIQVRYGMVISVGPCVLT